MEITQVKKQIQGKSLCPFYVFTGAEIEAQRIYINKIAEVTGRQIRRIEKVTEAFNKKAGILNTSSVFVCRDDEDFWKKSLEEDEIVALLGNNILILQMTDIDKRSKSYKTYSDVTVTFDFMDSDVIYKYLERVCALSDRAFDLINICENDYARVLLESDKVNRYARARGVSVDESFDALLADRAITRPPQDAIFDFTDALLRADTGEAFRLLQDCKAIGEPALRLISVLYTNFKRVLQYQICDNRDVCKTTGLTPYDVKLAKRTAGAWRSEDLVTFLKTLQRVEQGIKNGEIEEDIAMDYLMVTFL